MKVVIVGGGKVGFYVAKTLIEDGVEISLIEKDQRTCELIASELDIPVICDDGTTVEALLQAGTVNADAFIAVTGSDEDNIVAGQIAKRKFQVDRVISRANDPKNVEAMKLLGIDIAVSSTQIITDLIEMEVDTEVRLIATLNKGKVGIIDLVAGADFNPLGLPLSQIAVPEKSIIIAVVSGDEMEIPRGNTVIRPGDHITAIADGSARRALKKIFMG
ncbi:MAG: NAD-binding protein [Clostridia bacterium]|nr:NAD-binding protein [Clostridia bacterium]